MGLADRLTTAGWPHTLPPPDQLTYLESGFGTEVYAVPGVVVVRLARTVEAGQGLAREAILLRSLSGRLPAETPLPIWSANACDDLPHGALALNLGRGGHPGGRS